jgi:hypothetical protein
MVVRFSTSVVTIEIYEWPYVDKEYRSSLLEDNERNRKVHKPGASSELRSNLVMFRGGEEVVKECVVGTIEFVFRLAWRRDRQG